MDLLDDHEHVWDGWSDWEDEERIFLEMIQEKLLYPSEQRSRYITPVVQVLITLRFYASGSFLITVGDFGGVCTASVSNIVKRVSLAIAEHKQQYIKMPDTRNQMLNACRKFYAKEIAVLTYQGKQKQFILHAMEHHYKDLPSKNFSKSKFVEYLNKHYPRK